MPFAPPTGDRLVVAVGLTGSEDPADSVFLGIERGGVYQESPSLALRTWLWGC